MAPSRHDCKIVYRDVKQKKKNTKAMLQKAVSKSYWKFVDQIIAIVSPDQEYQPKQKRFRYFIKSLSKDCRGIALLKENAKFHADPRPNHCGRHLGRLIGHNSTYVLSG